MQNRPPPFLFDLDGTLADTIADIAASTNHVRQGYGLPPFSPLHVQTLVGHGASTLLWRALPELHLSPQPGLWEQAYERYAAHHEQQCTAGARLYPGVHSHLQHLAAAGHPLGVVTNKPARFARRIVQHLGLQDLLPVVVGGDTLPQRKPAPEPLQHALALLTAPTDRGTMVGDGETDLRAGKAAGLRTIACLFGYRPEPLLRAEGADDYWCAFGRSAPA